MCSSDLTSGVTQASPFSVVGGEMPCPRSHGDLATDRPHLVPQLSKAFLSRHPTLPAVGTWGRKGVRRQGRQERPAGEADGEASRGG